MTTDRSDAAGHRGHAHPVPVCAISALALLSILAWLYAPGFAGYWLGDDFGHVHQTFNWARDGRLWTETLGKFTAPADAIGSFYRPLIFVTLSANFATSGSNYAGWFLTNLLLHLGCALLVMWVVRRAAAALDLDARIAAVLAALVFAASPLLVEGVMWVSARSDLAVTAMALLAAGLWLGPDPDRGRGSGARALIPLLVVVGLGFKESAAVLPLQLLLLALARPREVRRDGWLALAAGAAVVGLFFAARAWWFDSAWHAYADGGERDLYDALFSLPQWWRGATASAPALSLAWLVGSITAALVLLYPRRGGAPQLRLAVALAGAGAGQLLATLLNLGSFAESGEGGRLLYGPIAWLAMSLGVLLATNTTAEPVGNGRRLLAIGFAVLAAVAGTLATRARVAQFTVVQDEMRALVAAIGHHASNGTGTTVLVIPDQRMGIVASRNGQGAMVMPPLQATGLLHSVVPTVPGELALRPGQFGAGLGTRLLELKPDRVDGATMRQLLNPAPPGAAPAYACWSSATRKIVPLPTRRAADIGPGMCAGIP